MNEQQSLSLMAFQNVILHLFKLVERRLELQTSGHLNMQRK